VGDGLGRQFLVGRRIAPHDAGDLSAPQRHTHQRARGKRPIDEVVERRRKSGVLRGVDGDLDTSLSRHFGGHQLPVTPEVRLTYLP
jgi:hypothetical protein